MCHLALSLWQEARWALLPSQRSSPQGTEVCVQGDPQLLADPCKSTPLSLSLIPWAHSQEMFDLRDMETAVFSHWDPRRMGTLPDRNPSALALVSFWQGPWCPFASWKLHPRDLLAGVSHVQ